MNALHFGDPTKSTSRSIRKYSHRRSAVAQAASRCQAQTTWRGHCLGLTERLRNVNIVLTLPQASTNRKLWGSWPVGRDQRPPETARQKPIQQFDPTQGHSICMQLVPAQTLDPHVITRQAHIRTHRCAAWHVAQFRQLQLL